MSKQKVVLITNIPNQYRIPLFNELHLQLEKKGMQLHVIFGTGGYEKRKSIIDLSECMFQYQILSSGLFTRIEKKTGFLFYVGLITALRKLKANQIIVGGYSFATMKIWGCSFFKKTNYFIWSGSIQRKRENTFRMLQRKFLIKRAKGCIAYGSLAKINFELLGAEPSAVIAIGNTVDTNFFERETARIKEHLPRTEKKYLTYVGYLTSRKNVRVLIDVVKDLSEIRKDFVLEIIGDGEERQALEEMVEALNLKEHILFHGFRQKEELPQFLARSNAFLFQTDFDIWGLVLNEAMAAGIPCLSSINAGATEDLIQDGITGFKVNFAESKKAAEKINWMLNHPKEMKELGKRASEFIRENYSLSACAERIISIA